MPLPIETYARLLAHLAARPRVPLADLLAELAISPAELRDAEPALRAQLSAAWPRRQGIAAMKFASALGDELAKLALLAPGADAEPPPAPLLEPEKALPSFLQPAQLPVSPPPLLPVMPPALPEALPVVHRPPSRLAGTAEADLSAIVAAVQRGALPFAASATPSPASVPEVERPPPAPPSPGSPPTMALPVMGDELDLALHPLDSYAALTGALARGEPREQVLAEHHLTPALFEKLAHAWGARFAGDPQLLERFQSLARSSASQGPRKP